MLSVFLFCLLSAVLLGLFALRGIHRYERWRIEPSEFSIFCANAGVWMLVATGVLGALLWAWG